MQDTISYNVISRMGHYSIGKLDLFNSELKINIRILIDIYIYIYLFISSRCVKLWDCYMLVTTIL